MTEHEDRIVRLEAAILDAELATLAITDETVFHEDTVPYNWQTEPDCRWLR